MAINTFAGAISYAHIGKRLRVTCADGVRVEGTLRDVKWNTDRLTYLGKLRHNKLGPRKARSLIKLSFGNLGTTAYANYGDLVEVIEDAEDA